jgi:8-oxo-dGTP pyrophosphatase MutT (NUDIX family)
MAKQVSRNKQLPETAQNVFTGKFFSIYQWPQELYDGSVVTFERAKRPDTAGVIAITPDKKILVTRQEQPALEPFWGLLGGVVDPGETPAQAAARELLEEGGYQAERWTEWCSFRPSSRVDWRIHTFIAHAVTKIQDPTPEPGEKIVVHAIRFDEFFELVQQDDFRNQEVALQMMKAMLNPEKMEAVQQLFFEDRS